MKEARDTWTKIRAWGLETGEDLQRYKQSVLNPPKQQDSPTLGLAVKEYLATSRHRESTRKGLRQLPEQSGVAGPGS